METKFRSLLFTSLFIGWLTLVATIYVVANRAATLHAFVFPEQINVFIENLQRINLIVYTIRLIQSLLGITIFVCATTLTGLPFVYPNEKPLARLLTAFAFGQVIYSIIFLATITVFTLKKNTTILVLASNTLFSIAWLIKHGGKEKLTFSAQNAEDWKTKAALFILFLLAATLSSSRLGYDAAAYYFSHSKLMAITGQPVYFYPNDAFVVSSFHPGILFTVIVQLFGDQTARLLSWANGLAIILFGITIGKKIGLSSRASTFFIILMLTSTAFVDLLGDGKIELICTTPILAAIYWMLGSLETPEKKRFSLIGLFLGFAIISRPYNIFLVPLFTILFYALDSTSYFKRHQISIKHTVQRLTSTLWMLPALILMGVFFLWQNQFWLGSPIAPITYAQNLDITDWQWQFDPAILTLLKLIYPLTVSFVNNPQSLGTISPLFIGALSGLLIKSLRKKVILTSQFKTLFFASFITLILWLILFFTVVEIRYVLFIWVILFFLASHIIDLSIESFTSFYNNLFNASIVLLITLIGLRILFIAIGTYHFDANSNNQTRCRDLPTCNFFEPVNQEAPYGSRVFALNAYRYYLRYDLFSCSSLAFEYENLKLLRDNNDPAFWIELYQQGFQYLVYEQNFAEFHSRFGKLPPARALPEWLNVEKFYDYDGLVLYRIHAKNPPYKPQTICNQTSDSIWELNAKNRDALPK